MSTQNETAKLFKSLHKPGSPIVLTNVWDAISARAVAAIPATKALATASAAVAAAAGIDDDDLTLDINLRAIAAIAKVAKEFNKPLTADFQDGFGEQLEDGVRQIIRMGVVGINLEDLGREKGGLYTIEEAQERVRRVMAVAREEGVPDFVVNARSDSYFAGHGLDDAITRGKAYLKAGASNVFIWGGPTREGWRRDEVVKACKELDGRLNVILVTMKPGGLSVGELGEIGVSRISVGPGFMKRTMKAMEEEARTILEGEGE
ncbi:similar to PEP phosphonomutase [Plenodomus lingam JN3]|uniref:Similar to PEP phosphonomutase n=1 Tax=Leptosphaeria maculans (strain JN3 / isolate v23.1.3 / race Av1-4-5-6-7-8) TaxID=985895 RepID=E4ZRL7_LEPMJ|nr:similar to PEP phosphonomutase [Plenodomus lingam JN3]CBX93864.1 similar to PEP phosphonomutase [Plenodomus lingam JN3]